MVKCESCGWEGNPETIACPNCFEVLLCPAGCRSDEAGPHGEGRHWYHDGACSWHDGSCEEPVWCKCEYRANP